MRSTIGVGRVELCLGARVVD